MASPQHRAIESLAYSIYVAEGRPEGKALQHWLEAEEQIEVEEQFQVEASLEPNIFGKTATKILTTSEA